MKKMSVRALPPPLAEKARMTLHEDATRIKDDIQHLKDWIAKQPHLRARTDDQWLIAFLRGCKYSLERTKEKLDLYYCCCTAAPELSKIKYTDIMFEEFLNLGVINIIPTTVEPDSPRVTIVRVGRWNPDIYNILDIISIIWTLAKIILMDDDQITVSGSTSIIDLEGVNMSLFLQITPTVMQKTSVFSQDASPVRVMGAHFLNAPPAFETIFKVIKTFLNEKHKNRFYVHKNYDELYKHVPKDILPVEYGGYSNTTEQEMIDNLKNKVKEYSEFLGEESQYGTDESKRPGKPRTAEDLFGPEGSFRKLELD